jgi:hypothetical protein
MPILGDGQSLEVFEMRSCSILLVGLLAAASAPARAAPPASKHAGAIDPEAIAALKKMSAFLRAQREFAVGAETSTDDVLPSGQKVKVDAMAELQVRRPDRMRADVSSDRRQQQMFFDGNSFTIYDLRTGYYASFQAPPTLAGLVDVAEKQYGIEFPLADLFYWGTDKSEYANIKAAANLGRSAVKGTACTHYAFRESDVDWQIWIQDGEMPLPRKLVITTVGEKTQPEHEVIMTWDLSPRIADNNFVFAPPAGARKIDFQPAPRPTGAPHASSSSRAEETP